MKYVILYDDRCALCTTSYDNLKRFDWLHKLAFLPLSSKEELLKRFTNINYEACQREMHVISPRGKVFSGFFAFRRIAWLIPVFWPLIILLYIPGISMAGRRIYLGIADKRHT